MSSKKVTDVLTEVKIDRALDPSAYTGTAEKQVLDALKRLK